MELGKEFGVQVRESQPARKDSTVKPPKGILCLCSKSAQVKDIIKQVEPNGTLVLYDSIGAGLDSVRDFTPAQVPYSAAIFNNISLTGFNLNQWLISNPDKFRKGCNVVEGLLMSNKIHLNEKIPQFKLDDLTEKDLTTHPIAMIDCTSKRS